MENIDLSTARAVKMQELWNLLIDNGYRLVKVITEDETANPATNPAYETSDPILEREIREAYRRAELVRLESDVNNPRLVSELKRWRFEKARAANVPSYLILNNRTLLYIAYHKPATMDELLSIPGFGPVKADNYGTAILEIVARNRAQA